MKARGLQRLFQPRTIAVFGGREAERVVLQCDRMGFSGEVWPVHPTREAIGGRRCFHTAAELPAAPDAAFIGVNRRLTVEIVRALARSGAGGAICYASGFREAEGGAALEDELLIAAGDMPIIGPNCYGLLNYLDRTPIWPDQHGGRCVDRGVAIITQSSNIAINMTMQRRALPIAYVATTGNQAQTSLADIASALLEDGRVTAIGLHVEGIKDVHGFEKMAFRARALGKPIVGLTVGRSEQARRGTVSHTASIAGAEAATAAYFARLGIPRLRSIAELLETLKLLHVHGPLPGGDLCSMSCSGGEASIMADAAIGRAVRFRPLMPVEQERVRMTLGDLVTIENPLDYHTFIWAREDAMTKTFAAMMGCGFDLSLLVLDFPRGDRCADADWSIAAGAFTRAAVQTAARAAIVATLPENMPEAHAAEILAAGIAPLCGLDEAVAAAEAAAFIGARWPEPLPRPLLAGATVGDPVGLVVARARTLPEAEAKAALLAFGVTMPPSHAVQDAKCAVSVAEGLGYPVVLKALGIAHKSDVGAVRLGLGAAAEVEAAAMALGELGTGLLIEAMVTDAVAELLIGVVRDPQFGLLMTIGAGGVLVELWSDTKSLLLPATEDEICKAILSLRVAVLLHGFRGRPAGDFGAAVAAALAVARYAEANAATLKELEINPLLVRPTGRGAVAVDAMIRMSQP